MQIAFIIFDRMTALDFIGIYDPLTRLHSMNFMPSLRWQICAFSETVHDDRGLQFFPTEIGQSLAHYDLIVVPGGYGTRELSKNDQFISWLKTAAPVPVKASVCTGALLFGAAGFLHGKRATTHPISFAELAQYAEVVTDQRVVDQGEIVTARGVTAALDCGLHLVERLAGSTVASQIRKQMDYHYPPG